MDLDCYYRVGMTLPRPSPLLTWPPRGCGHLQPRDFTPYGALLRRLREAQGKIPLEIHVKLGRNGPVSPLVVYNDDPLSFLIGRIRCGPYQGVYSPFRAYMMKNDILLDGKSLLDTEEEATKPPYYCQPLVRDYFIGGEVVTYQLYNKRGGEIEFGESIVANRRDALEGIMVGRRVIKIDIQ
ncbi:hypothetical protein F4774DRAFT_413774 [Daldinia eschscholtzii]|nr:hypothetical protein F4774DRAFT_413774 [Daldinia eschscholtzii]